MKLLLILAILINSVFCSCAGVQVSPGNLDPSNKKEGYKTYIHIRDTLEAGGDKIDYDTLIDLYGTIVDSQYEIPHIDQLLNTLIHKRNENPRVDQMVLIFSARAIRQSKFSVPNVYSLFESILKMNNSRLTEWVISFVASAIGHYAFDIPDGDKLVDLLETRLDEVQSAPAGSKEYFGFHFLPPPRSDFIRLYITGIKEQHTREIERMAFYTLIQNNITETEIETALKRLQAEGFSGTGEEGMGPMKYLVLNKNKIFVEGKKDGGAPDRHKP